MSGFVATLSPAQIGADVLVHVARQRLSGTLDFGLVGNMRTLRFKEGRAEQAVDTDGHPLTARPAVVHLLRSLAVLGAGRCTFTFGASPDVVSSLHIDTLGEGLIAIIQQLTPALLESTIAARAKYNVDPAATLPKLVAALQQVGGAVVVSPRSGSLLSELCKGQPHTVQRSWLALLILGGLRSNAPPVDIQPLLPLAAQTVQAQAEPIDDATPLGMKQEIERAFALSSAQDHYAFLGVPRGASVDVIRKAYITKVKRYHPDRFSGEDIEADLRTKADELFRRSEEANRVLTNALERQNYDWMTDRQAQGLPTDPGTIVEAESLFHKAETLVRRGQGAAAEPLMRRAVELNKGEPEFWAYFGFSIYSSKGRSAVEEARRYINKALQMNAKLDCAHEFLGRIAHLEGDISAARQYFEQAIKLNPKNHSAQRELRLLTMRSEQDTGLKEQGLLKRIFRR